MIGDGETADGAKGAQAAPRFRAPQNHRLVYLAASCAAIIAIWLIAIWQWIAADTVVPWDSKNQFYAFFRFLSTSLHSGVMPFWNPYHYGGHPSVADPQSLIFAPVFFLWAWFDPDPSIRAFDILVYAHLLAGSARARCHRLARGLAGGGLRARGLHFHVRRRGFRPPAAYRPDPELRRCFRSRC